MPCLGLGLGTQFPSRVSAFSAEASNYFSRLDTAGDTTYTDYKQPIANYIDGLVANGMWDGLETAALFVGVGFEGITVPLRSDMPSITNNNFVSGDWSVLTGLKGDGSTKYLDTGTIGTDLAQNDASHSVYVVTPATVSSYMSGNSKSGAIPGSTSTRDVLTKARASVHGPTGDVAFGTAIVSGLVGATRSDSANETRRSNQTNYPAASTSAAPTVNSFDVFSASGGLSPTDARLATYHAGASIDLATLETLQATLISEIAAI